MAARGVDVVKVVMLLLAASLSTASNKQRSRIHSNNRPPLRWKNVDVDRHRMRGGLHLPTRQPECSRADRRSSCRRSDMKRLLSAVSGAAVIGAASSSASPARAGSIFDTIEQLFMYGPGALSDDSGRFKGGEFKRIPTQFIAALGDPNSRVGEGAQEWGLWRQDPGPRGVWLSDYKELKRNGGLAPANWVFDSNDWWLEEHGIIMEKPEFPLNPGRYVVTGGRSVTTVLTIHPKDPSSGNMKWELDDGSLFDVTHLPCRSARYSPLLPDASPANANFKDFPVAPGAAMPSVEGYKKQDYAVLFVVGVESVSPSRRR